MVGMGFLFMLRCERIPFMLTWLHHLATFSDCLEAYNVDAQPGIPGLVNALIKCCPREEAMKRNGSLRRLRALLAVIVALIMTPGVWANSKYKTLHRFTYSKRGRSPRAGLIFDQTGNLFGTTAAGGNLGYCGGSGCGTVFELTPNGDGNRWKEKVLYRFTGRDGSVPHAGLIFDKVGNLYGTTLYGGSGLCSNGSYSGCGTVFELTPRTGGGWTAKVLYHFTGHEDGGYPIAHLIFDQGGNLYGTTFAGGSDSDCYQGCGTVFKLTPNSDGSWNESVLHTFCSLKRCRDGANPTTALIFDAAGNLYGPTSAGGTGNCGNGCGTVFELTPVTGGWKEKVLHNFTGGRDGDLPYGNLIFDQAGNLYGTSYVGGGYSDCPCGVVFKLAPNSDGVWNEKVLHKFTRGREGGLPYAGLVFDRDGNLYSTMVEGGSLRHCYPLGCGVVFKLMPTSDDGWKEIVLHRFLDHPGAVPYAGVILDAAGNLYGTTLFGGTKLSGVVFRIP